jgi:hypothetical protein
VTGSLTTHPGHARIFPSLGAGRSARGASADRPTYLTTHDVRRLRACSEQAARDALHAACPDGPVYVRRGGRGRPVLAAPVDVYAAWAGVDVPTLLAALR